MGKYRFLWVFFAFCWTGGAFTVGQEVPREQAVRFQPWLGPAGSPLPFESLQAIEQFLLKARVIEVEKIPEGITKPKRLTLELDGVTMRAVFRDIDDYRARFENRQYGVQFEFHDFCVYECAAYRLSMLLGLGRVPPTVRRTFERGDFQESKDFARLEKKMGALQAWVEGATTETQRLKEESRPPDMRDWANQRHLMNLWDNLIFNLDRNTGNILIGPNWKIWFIDQTRAFRPYQELREVDKVRKCDRLVWQRLREVEDSAIEAALGELLSSQVLKALLERRRLVVRRLETLIEQDGEELVLFDLN